MWGYKNKKEQDKVDYDPWLYDPDTGTIKRSREISMPIKTAMTKTASFYQKLADDFMGDANLFDEVRDPLTEQGLDKFGPEKSSLLDQSAPMTYPMQPSEEMLIERAYMVMFAPWGWDEIFKIIGKESMEKDYLKWSEVLHSANKIDDNNAAAFTDLIFFDELEADNFLNNAKSNWGAGSDLVSLVLVTLVPVSDSRVQEIKDEDGLSELDLGDYLGKVTMNNHESYYVFKSKF